MNALIGYDRAASHLAKRISEQMESVRPYMAFSVRGKRRSGVRYFSPEWQTT